MAAPTTLTCGCKSLIRRCHSLLAKFNAAIGLPGSQN